MLGELSRYIECPREVLARRLRNEANEGTYTPDSTTQEALEQPPRSTVDTESTPETPSTEGQGIQGAE